MNASIALRDRIIVALDFPEVDLARACVAQLRGKATYVKIGMELYYLAGPQIVHELKEQGFKIFVDLKMHDIPNTVKGAARSLTRLGVDMFNVHASGGLVMMAAAKEGLLQGLAVGQATPTLIGVTMLTSTDQQTMNTQMKVTGSVEEQVLHLARLTKQAGLDGVVASPLEVEKIKGELGSEFLTVTPGIRPLGADVNDQKRVTTPEEAIKLGTDYMVIGRAITTAENPGDAYEQIVANIQARMN